MSTKMIDLPDYPALTKEEKAVLSEVLKALRQIRHGYVHLVVQDSRVIQIEKTEKVRLSRQSCTRAQRAVSEP